MHRHSDIRLFFIFLARGGDKKILKKGVESEALPLLLSP